MYQTENVLPFLDKAKSIKTIVTNIYTKDIYCELDSSQFPPDKPVENTVMQALLVRPMGMIVLNATPVETWNIKQKFEVLTVELKEVNYREVAQNITTGIRIDGQLCAYYPNVNGYFEEFISPNNYIVPALTDYDIYTPTFPETNLELGKGRDEVLLTEAMKDDIDDIDMPSNLKLSDAPHVEVLRSYLVSSTQTNQVPLLLGKTAVAKSAIIKCLCNEFDSRYAGQAPNYGMRLVDIRASFMERTDIDGLCKTVKYKKNTTEEAQDGDDFQLFSTAAPMSKFVECSDGYINYCRDAIPLIKKEILKLSKDGDSKNDAQIEELNQLLLRYIEGAKIPILFFDEITRCSKSVMQCLTKILTDKSFMGYDMKIARVVAATNTNISKPSEADADVDYSELNSIYQTVNIGDQAVFDRFSSMLIQPSDVFQSWKEWATKGTPSNIHSLVLDYVKTVDIAYNQSSIEQIEAQGVYYNEQGEKVSDADINVKREASATSFPNFRTWEVVSKLLYAKEKQKTVLFSQVKGVLGNKEGCKFCEYLTSNGWSNLQNTSDDGDPMLEMVEECINTGTPTMLIAPSSVGKTARVKQAVDANDSEFIEINLAQQDKGDLMGLMTMVNTSDYIADGIGGGSENLTKELKALLKNKYNDKTDAGLPADVTIRAPKSEVSKKFVRAVLSGRKVVLFFDEVNRVQDTAIMSALFEAVSDHRIFGFDFSEYKDNVRVICACNLGDNMKQASNLDPAFAARFAIYRKRDYDQKDVNNFIKYAEKKKFTPELLSFLQLHKDDGLVLSMISSVDRRTLEMQSASTRAIEDLDKLIRGCKETSDPQATGNSIFAGTILCPAETATRRVSEDISAGILADNNDVEALLQEIDNRIDNWAGLLTNNAGSKQTMRALVDAYKKARSNGLSASDLQGKTKKENALKLIKNLISIDYKIATTRERMISSKIGSLSHNASDFGKIFTTHYNQVSGMSSDEVKVSEIVNENRIEPYITYALRRLTSKQPDQQVCGISNEKDSILDEVVREFGSNLKQVNLRKLFFGGDTPDTIGKGGIMARFSQDTRGIILMALTRRQDGIDALIVVENKEVDYILQMLKFCGYNTTKSAIEEILTTTTNVLTTYFK